MQKPVETAKALFRAFVEKDRGAAAQIIADDFHFTSPLDNKIDRATYFSICWPNCRNITEFDFKHLVEDGERVFATYEAGSLTGHRFRNTEILTVKDGKVTAVEVYFGWSVPMGSRKATTEILRASARKVRSGFRTKPMRHNKLKRRADSETGPTL